MEYCLFNEKRELNDLSPLEKLHIFVNTKNVEEYPILKYNEFNKVIKINKDTSKITEKELIRIIKDKDNNRHGIKEFYEIDNFYNLLFLEYSKNFLLVSNPKRLHCKFVFLQ